MIHPTAIVDSKAEIDSSVEIGPCAIINGDVVIGSGTRIGSHAVIEPYVTIGTDCHIFQYAAIGAVPQAVSGPPQSAPPSVTGTPICCGSQAMPACGPSRHTHSPQAGWSGPAAPW